MKLEPSFFQNLFTIEILFNPLFDRKKLFTDTYFFQRKQINIAFNLNLHVELNCYLLPILFQLQKVKLLFTLNV